MGTKQFSNYSDLLTFTRASGGHALRPVSYGDELVENGGFDEVSPWKNVGGAASTIVADGVCSLGEDSQRWVLFSNTNLEIGKLYQVSVDIVSRSSSAATLRFASGTNNYLAGETGIYSQSNLTAGEKVVFNFVYSTGHTWFGFKEQQGASTIDIDNVSVKEVTFDQPDGTLTLFEHPSNIPRVEWDAQGNRLGLLVEEARTNLVAYSENFNGSGWVALNNGTGTSPIITAAYAQSPDGTQTATRLQASISGDEGTDDFSLIQFAFGLRTGDFTNSIWIKSNTGEDQKVYFRILGNNEVTATQEWTRVSVTDNYPSAASLFMSVGIRDSLGSENLDILIWGAQGEAGSFPTSYIKTQGSTVSRAADVASIPVADFGYNQSEGTLFASYHAFSGQGSTTRIAALNDGSTSNSIQMALLDAGTTYHEVRSGGTAVVTTVLAGAITDDALTKTALASSLNDHAGTTNGGTVGTDTSGAMPIGITTLNIGSHYSGNFPFNGHIKSIKYYPRRLSDAQLVQLTS